MDVWRQKLLQDGIQELPLTGSAAIRAGELSDFHGEPADRMIVSIAQENSAALVTADKKILEWKDLQTIDASL